MATDHHETLVYRLAQILVKLNQGERLDPSALASEFGVNLRTIQRDLNIRFAYLPLQRTDGRYHLESTYLGKLSTRDVERFASLAGVRRLFPSLSDEFLGDLFDSRVRSALLVKGHDYEDLAGSQDDFRLLERAIIARCHVSFCYRKNEDPEPYVSVAPLKLLNTKGIWYLVARDGERLKTFSFSKIDGLTQLGTHFSYEPATEKMLQEEDGIWLGEEKKEIVLKVSREVAGYFKRRKLIANQVVEKELEDGGLIVSAKVGHQNQVLPIVRYWIPHLRIISPEGLQEELEMEIRCYLERAGRG